jgi:hypothetical protein
MGAVQMFKAVRIICLSLLLVMSSAQALDLSAITNTDAVAALRTALNQGAVKAVTSLGKTDGFLGNPDVKIPLPPNLQNIEKKLRRYGLGAQADQLITSINRAAEAAVPLAKPLLVDAIKSMSVADAKNILKGGDDSATQYFRGKTTDALIKVFRPIVADANSKVGVANAYNSVAGPLAQFGLIDTKQANLDDYVTQATLDGMFKMIASEERAIRKNPVGQTSAILRKVFSK